MRNDKLSLWLAPDDEDMEGTATTHTNDSWELYIINHLISHCNVGGLELIQEDPEVATDLWDNTINPACIAFEEQTGKPTKAMCKAIAGVIVQHMNRPSNWNLWQRIWWHRLPKVHDKTFHSKSVTSNNCPLD